MRLIGDYHTHTVYSHGKSTVRENVIEAMNKGLKTIAIAEHGPGHVFYGVSFDNLMKIKNEIEDLREEFKGKIEILMGLEANIMDFKGNLDITKDQAKELDFLACGYHNGIIPKDGLGKILFSPLRYAKKLSTSLEKKMIEYATDSMIEATYKYDLKFLTHPGAKFYVDANRLAKDMNKNTMLEINNKHGYLDVDQLRLVKDADIKFIINSDAHKQENVGNVSKALDRIVEAGFDISKVVNLEY